MAILTEEQTILQDQARNWVRDVSPVAKFRQMRDSQAEHGFLPETWQEMASLGWTGIIIPEQYGGSELDCRTFGVVLEELGRGLTASPLLASALIGASALIIAGNDEQKSQWLPGIADGSVIATLAVDEGPHHAPANIALAVTAADDGFVLNGSKASVLEGGAADLLIVAARTSGSAGQEQGISLFLVDGNAAGVARTALRTADHRGYADITFTDVRVESAALLGELDAGFSALDAVLDRARAGLAAEMIGSGAEAFDRTLEYLKTREQFGQLIGSFQSLGHRAATHFMKMEFARSCVEAALKAIDENQQDAAQVCSLAKCQMGEFLHDMTNDMIQMHGGIGMTDEFDAGFFIKRARATEAAFGNQSFHLRRYISVEGI